MAKQPDNALNTGDAGRGGSRAGEAAPVRVILVGRTGLDGKLRLDPEIELMRAKSALEAVGELSEAVREGSGRNVVILASDADPAKQNGGAARTEVAKAHDFLTALRQIDASVRVLRLEEDDGAAPVRAGYDGVVASDASAEVLRALVRGLPATTVEIEVGSQRPVVDPGEGNGVHPESVPDEEAAEAEASEAEAANVPEPEAAGAMGDGAEEAEFETPDFGPVSVQASPMPANSRGLGAGDDELVRLLVHGRDIVDAATALMRERLGGRDVVFVSSGRSGQAVPASGEASGFEVSVSWRGRQLGRLRSRACGVAELMPQASWLAAWLALRDQHAQLRDAAFSDPLTGACNRRFFDHFLPAAIDQARRERRSMTLLMFDIDDFKKYNDEYGHAAGDDILMETVRLLKSMVRPSDKVCRIGGDEFVVVFHEPTGPRVPGSSHPSDIGEIAERFQKGVRDARFPKLGREAPGTLTISGGLATFPWDALTAEELLLRADELALQGKRSGKGVIVFGPGADQEHGAK